MLGSSEVNGYCLHVLFQKIVHRHIGSHSNPLQANETKMDYLDSSSFGICQIIKIKCLDSIRDQYKKNLE